MKRGIKRDILIEEITNILEQTNKKFNKKIEFLGFKEENDYISKDNTHIILHCREHNITWDNYKDQSMEINYQDFRIVPVNGTGGGYLSNEIHYRVAYLRETIGPKNSSGEAILPNGHIHIGFANYETVKDRSIMLNYIKKILENFLEAL
jgi:hypothetical protein